MNGNEEVPSGLDCAKIKLRHELQSHNPKACRTCTAGAPAARNFSTHETFWSMSPMAGPTTSPPAKGAPMLNRSTKRARTWFDISPQQKCNNKEKGNRGLAQENGRGLPLPDAIFPAHLTTAMAHLSRNRLFGALLSPRGCHWMDLKGGGDTRGIMKKRERWAQGASSGIGLSPRG